MSIHPSIPSEIARRLQADTVDSGKGMSRSVRELAQRVSGKDEVLLLWYPESDRVEVCVRDVATGMAFNVDVAPDTAIDAFYHPYTYLVSSLAA